MAEPVKRNAASLHQRVDELVETYIERYQSVLRHAREDTNTDFLDRAEEEAMLANKSIDYTSSAERDRLIREDAVPINADYGLSAHKELLIKEDAMAIITAAQNTSTLVRELQELWLFGSLDTLPNPADAEADQAKAMEMARLIEKLATKAPPTLASAVDSQDGGAQNGNGAA